MCRRLYAGRGSFNTPLEIRLSKSNPIPAADSAAAEDAAKANAEKAAAENASKVTHVEARVLADCAYGKPNDLAHVPVGEAEEAVSSFLIDTHPAAVDYARRLAAGEIQA